MTDERREDGTPRDDEATEPAVVDPAASESAAENDAASTGPAATTGNDEPTEPAAVDPASGPPVDRGELRDRARAEMRRLGLVGLGWVLLLALLVADALRRQEDVTLSDVEPPASVDAPLPDFTVFEGDVTAKKSNFFDYLLPIVEYRNAWVRDARDFLLDQRARVALGETPDGEALERLEALMTRYRVAVPETGLDVATLDALLFRADEIPASLALAQAASESAWGTSRFARSANNLFGEWCYSEGCGVVPRRRPEGATHEVEAFETPAASVDSYFRNLNSGRAYREVRELRARARASDREPTGALLADGLDRYSERGQDYIEEIRAIIRVNDLDALVLEDDAGDTLAGAL